VSIGLGAMQFRCQAYRRWLSLSLLLLTVTGCYPAIGEDIGTSCRQQSLQVIGDAELGLLEPDDRNLFLRRSWVSYRDQFITEGGRVVDREADDRTTSEGQAYAMLRAIFINDRQTFERVLSWAEANLARQDDRLWAWHWGETAPGQWQIVDPNFATDADIDAITALILASRRWDCPAYLALAREKLDDLWVAATAAVAIDQRYLLPGPAIAFWSNPETLILNPSYFAPYAFRLFAQVDPKHDWLSLVESSYDVLNASGATSSVGLPSDWIQLNLQTGEYSALPADSPIQTRYSFDAFRVWWRIALDASWFQESRATQFLQTHLLHLRQRWQADGRIPARLTLEGQSLVDYEATAQYAMLYPAFQVTAPLIAQQIYQQKLLPTYQNGYWDNDEAYYSQNLAWLSLLPSEPPAEWLQP
jgi:endo-1,4-beta-D-glucanase Y